LLAADWVVLKCDRAIIPIHAHIVTYTIIKRCALNRSGGTCWANGTEKLPETTNTPPNIYFDVPLIEEAKAPK
jgi:hypothetical protein